MQKLKDKLNVIKRFKGSEKYVRKCTISYIENSGSVLLELQNNLDSKGNFHLNGSLKIANGDN